MIIPPPRSERRAGLAIRRSGDPLDLARTRGGSLALLLSAPGLEVTEGELHDGERVTLVPSEEGGGAEAWYLLSGRFVDAQQEARHYGPGDLISGDSIRREIILSAEGAVRFLYLSTRPQFHAFSEAMGELMGLAVDVEEKDGYTADHCVRLQRLSFALGRELGLDSHRLHLLDYGAYLHDVGKIRIPASILQKPGPLTDDEWEIVRKHPGYGRDLVRSTFLADAGTIIHQHHERMDGSGYPFGRTGDEILPESYIVAIVDTYDAMTTDRAYRAALPVAVALEEIERGAGVLWPREHVRAFRSALPAVEPPGRTSSYSSREAAHAPIPGGIS